MDRDSVLEQLTQLDFMALDLAMYLDTHPDDRDAITHYNAVINDAQSVREKFEQLFGPLCSFRSESSPDNWGWIECPWPWECDANFTLKGDC
ncbi:MAG: spore coat protein CotJB [Defluviitaleaceae bacterium]|nr:spore coat protein CotJB [Defluviitaleaceae bacterium]